MGAPVEGVQLDAGDIEATCVADRPYLRLDCAADNTRLRAYYEAAGFAHRGDVEEADGAHRYAASLYELPVGSAAASAPLVALLAPDEQALCIIKKADSWPEGA